MTAITMARAAAPLSSVEMRRRQPVARPDGSRQWLDAELGDLRRSPSAPASWWRFIIHSFERSREQWCQHPRAARDLLVAHLALFAATRKPWVVASFVLCATHLGLLGDDDRLESADLVSLARANLPAVLPASRWSVPAAALSDGLDGWLARRMRRETAFGAYLDGLADVAFWSWFSIKREPKPALRILGLAFWAVPAIGITAAYFVTGRTIDYPRLRLVRQVSAVVQVALAMRSFSSAVTRVTVRPTASAGH
ncbi:MAG: CDP-alcohol phosphatidyltransferase family protein [Candidatus Dormibacteraceae bacterium]